MSDDFLEDLESQLHAAAVRRASGAAAPRRARRGFTLPRLLPVGTGLAVAVLAVVMVSRFGNDTERSVPVGAPPAAGCVTEEMRAAVPYLDLGDPGGLTPRLRRHFGDGAEHARRIDQGRGGLWVHPECETGDVCLSPVFEREVLATHCVEPGQIGKGEIGTYRRGDQVFGYGFTALDVEAVVARSGSMSSGFEAGFGIAHGVLGGEGPWSFTFQGEPALRSGARVAVLNGTPMPTRDMGRWFEERNLGVRSDEVESGPNADRGVRATAVYFDDRQLADRVVMALGGADVVPTPMTDEIREAGKGADVVIVVGRDALEVDDSLTGGATTEIPADPVTPFEEGE